MNQVTTQSKILRTVKIADEPLKRLWLSYWRIYSYNTYRYPRVDLWKFRNTAFSIAVHKLENKNWFVKYFIFITRYKKFIYI